MTEPQKETVKHRVTYIANEEETPYVDCEDVGRYMCGDCGQHTCDDHFGDLRHEDCPDRTGSVRFT